MSLHLETARCLRGCPERALLIRLNDGTGYRVYGCGGPYGAGTPFPVSSLAARERKAIQEVVVGASARGEIPTEDAGRFLAEVFR